MENADMKYPQATFIIVSYNQEKYIAEAIDGAFAQDYPNLEIIISDDCSRDKTWDIIQEKANQYKGSHKVIINRNEPNLGPREHFNKVLYDLSHGDIIVLAGGDDISRKDRVSKCVDVMLAHPSISSLSCMSQTIHEDGIPFEPTPWNTMSTNHLSIYTLWDYVYTNMIVFSGDSRVLRRNVIDSFPPLKYSYAEDVYLFIRSFYVGDVALIHEPLVKYRQHDSSIMGKTRLRKKVSKEEYKQFEQTSAKQIRVDLQYAIDHNYIETPYVDIVSSKIEDIISWLRPQQKTFPHRVIRKIKKHVSRWCNKLDEKLP